MSKQPDIKVTLCMVSFNRLDESIIWVRRHCKHVDRTIIIDGGSTDGSVEFFNSKECKELGVECYVHPWVDNPPEQRNRYLDMVKEGWVLVLDCDELLSTPAIYRIRYVAKDADDRGCDGVSFLAHDIQTDLDGGVHSNLSNYHNRMFFKACPGMKYVGHTHVALSRPGMRDRCMRTDFQYFHIKPWADQFIRACRNYWTTCAVANNRNDDPSWIHFKKISNDAGFTYFYQFLEYMRNGNIDIIFKEWFIAHKEDENPEARSWFVSYFLLLHPEENVLYLGNKDLQFSPDLKPVKLQA
jgi:glycosyltransferase involved in cell wall biosynthesis